MKKLLLIFFIIMSTNTYSMEDLVQYFSHNRNREEQLAYWQEALEQAKEENDPTVILYIEKTIEQIKHDIELNKKNEAKQIIDKPATSIIRRIGIVHGNQAKL